MDSNKVNKGDVENKTISDEDEDIVIWESIEVETCEISRDSIKLNHLNDPNKKNEALRKKRTKNCLNVSHNSNSEQSSDSKNVSDHPK
jgi:hypothetical protein